MITPRYALQRAQTRAGPGQATLTRFVLLSMLLHATVIVFFGTSHGGGAGRGERALDDVLDVTLGRLAVQSDAGRHPLPDASTAVGRDLSRRIDQVPPPPAAPERSETGPTSAPAATGATPPAAAPIEPQPIQAEPVPPRPHASEALPRIDLRAPEEVDKPLAPSMIAPPRIERLPPLPAPAQMAAPFEIAPPITPAAPIERIASPATQRALAPAARLAPRETPIVPALPIERVASPAPQRELAAPVELAPRTETLVPIAPVERLASPASQRELAAPVELAPRTETLVPIAPVERLASPASQRELAAPVELAPRAETLVPIAPVERLAPPTTQRALAAPIELVPRAPSASVIAPGAPTAPVPASPATAAPDIERAVSPATTLPRLHFDAPAAEEDIFRPRRDVGVPSAEPGVAPRVDMNAVRKRAREIASETGSARGILPALPPPAERKSKESLALEKAIKPDCRTAYAGMGLLAVPALVVSTIGDGGCRW